ncbi:uncharacterized protein BO97DRAFT_405118 [Aspergillus homomorphus CBS 101889]|uniref:LIM zinc-binding domain-containing protein n=1 Tax=Aspergillus homomorphus (strain CBS 101889) TaxID=1450537 RepID=A0A395HY25_ASPHC|nr:hypothetical protein BO97DRAFT_405118 [Aspergillus homomorphus CBS 101889]RAL12832.1 hypothetical protein BO97DRAFT_405118 [Aspergillus homomorphus CBS 101889]
MPLLDDVVKTFPPRGNMQQHRLSKATNVYCTRCNCTKTAKLVTTIDEKWDELYCNACYGNNLATTETAG